ncbi:MAG: nucleotidyl transferase AbiEii/AbiGii toxin family protein [Desulfomonilia bacterium]
MYREQHIRSAELLQVLLLDNLYALSGSEHIMFQGGTAIRWIHGGMRFSEDLDFVTHLPFKKLSGILDRLYKKMSGACTAQFGPGSMEYTTREKQNSLKTFFIFRPERRRERIAVKLEYEHLIHNTTPRTEQHILRDLPSVIGLVTSGNLIMPYSSSIVVAETQEQILSDKVRALYERTYLKGRDLYDIWWLHRNLGIRPSWPTTRDTFHLYQTAFSPKRQAKYFQQDESITSMREALSRDLSRFLPSTLVAQYEAQRFSPVIESVRDVTGTLLQHGMQDFLARYNLV